MRTSAASRRARGCTVPAARRSCRRRPSWSRLGSCSLTLFMRRRASRTLGQHFPALALRNRPTLANSDAVAGLEAIGLVVRHVLLRTFDEFLIDRVHHPALHENDDGLLALVAHHNSL